jgi:splicing factor 3B subunit 4
MSSAFVEQRNQEATLHVGSLDERVSEELLWELFVQCGPVVHVHIPKDKVSGRHSGFGFVEMRTIEDAEYAMAVMQTVRLFGKPIRINRSAPSASSVSNAAGTLTGVRAAGDVGANLFVGNLASDVDEQTLFDAFSAFGRLIAAPKVMRDSETGAHKGFGFVSFDNFASSDGAIEALNGQFLGGRQISVQYAFRKDAPSERHGSQAGASAHTPSLAFLESSLTLSALSQNDSSLLPSPPAHDPTRDSPQPPTKFRSERALHHQQWRRRQLRHRRRRHHHHHRRRRRRRR